MTRTGHLSPDWTQGPITIRALHSLRNQHAQTINQAIAGLDRGWSVQTCDDYEGYLSILIEPVEQGGAQSSYLISGTLNRIELARLYGDDLVTLSTFDAFNPAVDQLVRLLQIQGKDASAAW